MTVGQFGLLLTVVGIAIDLIATMIVLKLKWKKVGREDLFKNIMEEQNLDEHAWIVKKNKENNQKWMLFLLIMFGVILTLGGIGLQQIEFSGIVEQLLKDHKE